MLFKLDLLRTSVAGQGLKSFRSIFKWITTENLCRVIVGSLSYSDNKGQSLGSMSPKCSVGTLYCLINSNADLSFLGSFSSSFSCWQN